MRLGDLDALKEVIKANHYLLSAKNNSTDYGMFTTGIMQAIDNAPTVDKGYAFGYADGHGEGYELGKNSRPQGEWVWVQYDANPNIGNWHCSECHCIPHGKKEYQRTNFCPNCGADMRKGGAE